MDEEGGKEATSEARGGGGPGDAPKLFPVSEEDSGISLASQGESSKTSGGVSSTSSSGKETISSELDTNEADSSSQLDGSPEGVEDVEMSLVADRDSSASSSPKVKLGASNGKVKHLSPGSCEEEEGMSVDPEDVVFSLDKVVEGKTSPNVVPSSARLDTVLSPGPSEMKEEDGGGASEEPASATSGDEPSSSSQDRGGAEVVAPEDLPDLSTDSDDDTVDSLDDEDEIVNPSLLTPSQRQMFYRRRQRRKNMLLRSRRANLSFSDSDDAITEEDRNEGRKSPSPDSDNEDEIRQVVHEVLNKVMPRPNWFALQELRRREYHSGCRMSSAWFRSRVQSSLHMVRKLSIQDRMQGHEGCVNALSFNRIGTLLASGSDDLNIVLWNWQRTRPSVTYESGHRSNVFQAKFMPFSGDCHVISCARDGQVRLAELNSSGVCKATRKLAQHRGAAHKLALELDSPHVFLSCGEDALVYLFDLRQEKPHRLVTARENHCEKKVPLYSIHSNPSNSNEFCVGGRDHYIRVFDKRKISEQTDGGVLKKLCPDHLVTCDLKANVTCACYNYSGTEILATYNDEDIYLFDNTMSDGANYIHKYTGHRNSATVKGVNFYGPKSEYIVSGSDCGNVFFWDKNTEAVINFQEGDDTGVINVLEPHPTLPILATSGLDYDVKLWTPKLREPELKRDVLKKAMKKNLVARSMERVTSEPEIGGQMLWFIMHHFRNSARRRMREEGQVLSSSDDDEEDSHSDDSENNHMQCAQS